MGNDDEENAVHDNEQYKCPSCNVYMKWDELAQDYECTVCRRLLCEFDDAIFDIIHG